MELSFCWNKRSSSQKTNCWPRDTTIDYGALFRLCVGPNVSRLAAWRTDLRNSGWLIYQTATASSIKFWLKQHRGGGDGRFWKPDFLDPTTTGWGTGLFEYIHTFRLKPHRAGDGHFWKPDFLGPTTTGWDTGIFEYIHISILTYTHTYI